MSGFPYKAPSILVAVSVVAVAAGVAIHAGFESVFGTIPALFLMASGIAGVTSHVRSQPVDSLQSVTRRWWGLALATFVPYGVMSAPSSESAAAVGEAFSGPVVSTTLEAFTGAFVLCAVAITVLYGFACYGIHPGRRSPEERLLDD